MSVLAGLSRQPPLESSRAVGLRGQQAQAPQRTVLSCTSWSIMHELAITQEIVEVACRHAGGEQIKRIALQIGKLSAVLPDAVRFCFELCAEGTAAERAELAIEEPPGVARCRSCEAQVILTRPVGQCDCGSMDLEWLSGEELRIIAVEVA